MNYKIINIKNLLIMSSIVATFINPINASDSEDNNYYGEDNYNFQKSKKEINNKKESNKQYKSKIYNLNKEYSDDYYDNSELSKEEKIKNRDLKTSYKQNKLDLYNSSGKKYNLSKKEDEKLPYKYRNNSSSNLSDSSQSEDFKNRPGPTRFIGPYKQTKKECVGKDCNKNEPKFSSYVYSSSSSMVSNGEGTWINQEKYDMAEDNNMKRERRQFSKGDSNSGIVNTKYKKLALDKKTNKKVEQKDEWKEEFSDFMQGKHKNNKKRLISGSENK